MEIIEEEELKKQSWRTTMQREESKRALKQQERLGNALAHRELFMLAHFIKQAGLSK